MADELKVGDVCRARDVVPLLRDTRPVVSAKLTFEPGSIVVIVETYEVRNILRAELLLGGIAPDGHSFRSSSGGWNVWPEELEKITEEMVNGNKAQ